MKLKQPRCSVSLEGQRDVAPPPPLRGVHKTTFLRTGTQVCAAAVESSICRFMALRMLWGPVPFGIRVFYCARGFCLRHHEGIVARRLRLWRSTVSDASRKDP